MSNPTTPFSWQMPTATDLVTDLPADFEVFGQAVATSMADLLGGTSGQVLSKTTNADMDFTWVTSDDANAIQNAIVNAKGDIIGATANDVPAITSVGANGEALYADSAATAGLRYVATPSASNPVLNSAFNVFQRGTTFAITTPVYTADRWMAGRSANTAGSTVTRRVTGDTTNLPSIQYCLRFARDSASTSLGTFFLNQSFESANSIPFAGKTVRLSFYARAGANYSAAGSLLTAKLVSGTGTDQNLLTAGYTGSANVISDTATLTTTWQRFTYSGSVGSTATELGIMFESGQSGTAGAADYFELTGVEIDIGNVALPFRTAGVSYQQEVALCQRYYYRLTPGASGRRFGSSMGIGATGASLFVPFLVSMRTQPTALEQSGTAADYSVAQGATVITCSAVPTFGTATTDNGIVTLTVTAGTVDTAASMARAASTSAYLAWSAEL